MIQSLRTEIIQTISQVQEHTFPEVAQLEGAFAWRAVRQALCTLWGGITWQFVLFLWFRLCQLLGEKEVSARSRSLLLQQCHMCIHVLELKEILWLGFES